MALNGTGLRFVDAETIAPGTPGGKYRCTIAAFPTGSYPALGEAISDLLAAVWAIPSSQPKVPTGVAPSNVFVEAAGGHQWAYDPSQGTMGTLRNWTGIGASPTEHATGVYSGTENTTGLRVTLEFPLYGDMSR